MILVLNMSDKIFWYDIFLVTTELHSVVKKKKKDSHYFLLNVFFIIKQDTF